MLFQVMEFPHKPYSWGAADKGGSWECEHCIFPVWKEGQPNLTITVPSPTLVESMRHQTGILPVSILVQVFYVMLSGSNTISQMDAMEVGYGHSPWGDSYFMP